MSLSKSEQEKYKKKYLKYKEKYFILQKELNEEQKGGSIWKTIKSSAKSAGETGLSVAKQVVSHPLVQSAVISTAMQNPDVQTKLSQAQQAYANSPTAQLASQVALSHPTIQSAISHPVVTQVLNETPSTSAQNSKLNPDQIWQTLTLEQKQKLISML